MDTTHMEYTAEDLISYKLQRSGLLVAKPKFDRNGADLLAFMNVDEGTKFCRIQCKGRSLLNSNSSNVEVLKSYVTDAFILLLFINDGNEQSTNLFCFFSNDIKNKWKLKAFKNRSKDFYRLSFSKTTINNVNKRGNLQEYYLTDQKIENIKNIIKHSDTKKEFKIVFDLMKNQNDLIKLQKKKNELEELIKDIKHIEEVKSISEEQLQIMEEHYANIETQFNAKNQNKTDNENKNVKS